MKEKIFLLGGYDLEMLTIRELLEQNGIKYYDKHLSWHNAKLEQYKTELEQFGNKPGFELYGIELQEKDSKEIPANYCRIDHHNEYNHLPSAIEQTAGILQITLNREQQLIAANDSGYIPAMQKLGATGDEIQEIRLKDRKVQGVTGEDEQLAIKAIKDKIVEKGTIVVKSETNRFSPITDRLFPYNRLLIYTTDELMYYGQGKDLLAGYFEKEIASGRMFHGGGDTGYIGTAQGVFPEKELLIMKDKILEELNR